MKESGYYPPGAEFDPNAPYNEKVNPEREFKVCTRQTMVKHSTVCTTDYYEEYCDEDGHTYVQTDETDWGEAWASCNKGVGDLIAALKSICATLIEDPNHKFGEGYLNELSEECDGWEADTDFDEYEQE